MKMQYVFSDCNPESRRDYRNNSGFGISGLRALDPENISGFGIQNYRSKSCKNQAYLPNLTTN